MLLAYLGVILGMANLILAVGLAQRVIISFKRRG